MTSIVADVVAPLIFAAVLICSYVCGGLFLQLIFVVTSNDSLLEQFYFKATFAVIVALYAAALGDASSIFPKAFTSGALTLALGLLVGAVVILGPCWSSHRLLTDFFGTRTYSRALSRSPLRTMRSIMIALTSLVFSGLAYIAAWRGLPLSPSITGEVLTIWDVVFGKVAYVGVVGMGVLGGYAAFSTPQAFLMPYLSRNGGEQAVVLLQALSKRQRYLVNLWAQKKRHIAQLHAQVSANEGNRSSTSRAASISSWIAGAVARVGGGGQQTIEQLESECSGIEKVSTSIFLQTQDVHQAISVAERGRSFTSRAGALVGVFLSIYAAGRVLLITLNVVIDVAFANNVGGSGAGSDSNDGGQVPRALSLLLSVVGNNASDGGALTRAAILFNALTILMSLRGFMLTIFRLTTSYASSVSSRTMIVTFTTCMGAYFIGQVLMLRLQLPNDSHSSLVTIIGALPRQPYQRLNDVCFLASCILAFLLHRFVLQRDRNVID